MALRRLHLAFISGATLIVPLLAFTACGSGQGAVCEAAERWRVEALEFNSIANEPDVDYLITYPLLQRQFGVLTKVALPSTAENPDNSLLSLMRRHNSETDRLLALWVRGSDAEREAARQQLNETIDTLNGYLESDCGLEPLPLYQPLPPG